MKMRQGLFEIFQSNIKSCLLPQTSILHSLIAAQGRRIKPVNGSESFPQGKFLVNIIRLMTITSQYSVTVSE
jgi:hypothetical protein